MQLNYNDMLILASVQNQYIHYDERQIYVTWHYATRQRAGENGKTMRKKINNCFKERGGGQNFSTSFWMRFSQAPLCRYRFKFIFDDILFLLSGNIIEYICF